MCDANATIGVPFRRVMCKSAPDCDTSRLNYYDDGCDLEYSRIGKAYH